MPLTAAQTSTAFGNTAENPVQTGVDTVVHVTLKFQGLSFDPAALYNALVTQYGAGKVSSMKDSVRHRAYQLVVVP